MFAETLAGIALVKSAVDGIKSAIDSQDISEIADDIDKLFTGEQQIQKKKQKRSSDPFSVGSVARETIDAKLAAEHARRSPLWSTSGSATAHGSHHQRTRQTASRTSGSRKTATPSKREAAGRVHDRRSRHPRAAHRSWRLRVPLHQICLRRDTP